MIRHAVFLICCLITCFCHADDSLLRLKRLSELPGASGFEDPVAKQFKVFLNSIGIKYTTDKLGNVLSQVSKVKRKKRILFMAHLDEVGFIISDVTDEGYIKALPLGGWVAHSTWAHEWLVNTEEGGIPAISGIDSAHVLVDFTRVPDIKPNQLFFDTGFSKAELIKKGVRPGLSITPKSDFRRLGHFVTGKAFDDRAGIALILDILDYFSHHPPNDYDIVFAATTQEELGMRNAKVINKQLKPDIVINIDSGIAHDYPMQFSTEPGPKLAKGPVIFAYDGSMIPNQKLVQEISRLATQHKIPFQWGVELSYGQDGSSVQNTSLGAKVINIGVPVRYVHSHNGVMSLNDYAQTRSLLLYIPTIKGL